MSKDDFDINFDFDKEYDFDPQAFLNEGEFDDNIDLSQYSDSDLGLNDGYAEEEYISDEAPMDDSFELDLEGVDLGEYLDEDGQSGEAYDGEDFLADIPSFSQRERSTSFSTGGYGATPELPKDSVPSEIRDYPDPQPPEETQSEQFEDAPISEAADQKTRRLRLPKISKKEKAPKEPREPAAPNIFTKFFDLYFAPVLHKEMLEEPRDPNNPRRRRRKSKVQIFKEVYLPPIVVCVTMVLVLSFAIGSLGNFMEEYRLRKDTEASRLESQVSAEELQESASQTAMEEAAALAYNYQYGDAITRLDQFLATIEDPSAFPELTAIRSDYVTKESQLKEYQDPSLIPNLSFHVLINDMARAKQDLELGGLYNKNFVTTAEFKSLLGELYNNGYVLVDFHSFTENINGTIHTKSIYLPPDKKPIMLTETMVNYFQYMIDSNDDWEADAGGDGFASKLVLDDNGDIKAEYVDATGAAMVGDYDFVPILESFIAQNPDFSYRGARATLAVTGSEGIFGYRINSYFRNDISATFHDEQVAGAKRVVAALREKGYTLACFTYDNKKYGDLNANQITDDLQQWAQQITPVIGEVDVLVYARESDIADYGGNAFTVMYTSGFRYFVSNSTAPSTEVNTTYVRQKRLMVTGQNMAWRQDMFTGIFDPNLVIDMTVRGSVVND